MHRLTSQAFELLRIALISGAMALIDVVAGRVLHAHPNPTAVLALLAGYLAASVAPGARSISVGVGVGAVSGACYLVAFISAAAVGGAPGR